MKATLTNRSSINPVKRWLFFLPIYVLLVGIAYHFSGTIFIKTVDADKYFGISFSKAQIFNQLLFCHLSIAIGVLAFVHLISGFTGSKFTIGRYFLAGLLAAALILFILGVNLPLISTTKFYFIKENYSLIDVLENLKVKNEMLLYWVMLIFTFIVPLLKMAGLSFEIFFSKSSSRKNRIISLLSKWAMIDVLVLAVLIACMKSGSGLVEMTSSNGLIYFAASVIVSLIISTLLQYTPFLRTQE